MDKTIQLSATQVQAMPTVEDVRAALRHYKATAYKWLSKRSDTFSTITGENFTRLSVVRIHLFLASVAVAMLCLVSSPLITMASLATSAWVVYRLNAAPPSGSVETDVNTHTDNNKRMQP